MKVKIDGNPALCLEPHNHKFSHLDQRYKYIEYIQIFHYPRKALTAYTGGKITKVYLRLKFSPNAPRPVLIVYSEHKTICQDCKQGQYTAKDLVSYTVTEREHMLSLDYTREELIALGDLYVADLGSVKLAGFYNCWAHPKSFDEVAALLTPSQKLEAMKLLRKKFNI